MSGSENPAPRANAEGRATFDTERPDDISTRSAPQSDFRMAMAGDGLAYAARLIVLNALAAESAALAGDATGFVAPFRVIVRAVAEARDIWALAGGRRG